MTFAKTVLVGSMFLGLAACTGADQVDSSASATGTVSLRRLTEVTYAPAQEDYPLQGRLIPTPSDPKSRYYLLRKRRPLLSDAHIAIIRKESGPRIAYARVEVDCGKRLFHVLGVGNRRSFAETSTAYDGPLRSIDGLPLREELATFVCDASETPLAKA